MKLIVSTAFNKMQSQNVMKVSTKVSKFTTKRDTLEGLAIPGVSQVSTGTSIGAQ
jgi:iron complex outermembrane receptor protein